MNEDQEYYVGQKAFIQKDDKVLVIFYSGGLDFPGGKIQIGETDLTESLKREVREEAGIEIEVGKPFHTWTFEFDSGPRAGKKVFLVGYRCSYVSGEPRISDEHKSLEWITRDDVERFQEGSKEYNYRALKKYFEGS